MNTQVFSLAGYNGSTAPLIAPLNITGKKAIVNFINMSGVSFALDFGYGKTAALPPNYVRPMRLPSSFQHVTMSVNFYPAGTSELATSHLVIETYFADDDTSFLREGPIPLTPTAGTVEGVPGVLTHFLGGIKIDQYLQVIGLLGFTSTIAGGLGVSGGENVDALVVSGLTTMQNVQVLAGTSGEIDYNFPIWDNGGVNNGGLKIMTVSYRGYIQAVTNPTVLFPTPMNRCIYLRGSSSGIIETFMNGASNVNINDITTLGGTSGGIDTSSSTTHSDTFGWVGAATDRIKFGTSTTAIDGFILIAGA